LQRHSVVIGQAIGAHEPVPFGSCVVRNSIIYSRAGKPVAELGCGILVRVPGIVDFVGAQVGAPAATIVNRYPNAAKRAICVAGKGETRCWFNTSDEQEPYTRYTVAGTPDSQTLRGPAALAFFSRRRIIRFHETLYCH
jgi:hypothetical protein